MFLFGHVCIHIHYITDFLKVEIAHGHTHNELPHLDMLGVISLGISVAYFTYQRIATALFKVETLFVYYEIAILAVINAFLFILTLHHCINKKNSPCRGTLFLQRIYNVLQRLYLQLCATALFKVETHSLIATHTPLTNKK